MNDLDQLLRGWADRNEPPEAAFDELRQRIQKCGRRSVCQSTDDSRARQAGSLPHVTAWWAIAAVAASLLAAVIVLRERPHSESLASDPLSLPTESLSARQMLFVELDRLFDGQWRWLGEVNGRAHLQTDDSPSSAHDESSDGLAVRLTVVQRRRGEANWHVVWEASVLARSEEWVRLPAELTGDNAVSVWAYSLPDGSTLVESDVALTAPVPVHLSEQHVFGASLRPARLWSARRSNGEFQLIQSIARLEAHHG
ncbi:MAG TPA: hypothetical protein VK137_06385 [Planctomycetaceae bacterium]|nr:hypothetical protein [Planctomycetaceae bacterium]